MGSATTGKSILELLRASVKAADDYERHRTHCTKCWVGQYCETGWTLKIRADIARNDAIEFDKEGGHQ